MTTLKALRLQSCSDPLPLTHHVVTGNRCIGGSRSVTGVALEGHNGADRKEPANCGCEWVRNPVTVIWVLGLLAPNRASWLSLDTAGITGILPQTTIATYYMRSLVILWLVAGTASQDRCHTLSEGSKGSLGPLSIRDRLWR